MFRFILCFLSLLFLLNPVFAGSFEDALKSSDNVVLYMSSPTCGYCKKFEPIYEKLNHAYGNKCKFVKVDVTTKYGQSLASQVGVRVVPFVMLFKTKQKMMTSIAPECLLDYACISKEVGQFIK